MKCFTVQARVLAVDGGTPSKSAESLVTINILRNLNAPIFNESEITRTVYEDAPLSDTIFTTFARDADRAVNIHFLCSVEIYCKLLDSNI